MKALTTRNIELAQQVDTLRARVAKLEHWLQWCMDNCDDSPEYNFGTDATEKMKDLLSHK